MGVRSVGKVLATQPQGSKFKPQNAHIRTSCNGVLLQFQCREAGVGGSLRLTVSQPSFLGKLQTNERHYLKIKRAGP